MAGALVGERYVAAPILGGPQAVLDGQASYLLAGPSEVVDGLEPLWVALSVSHRRCGEDPGTATTLKIVANYLLLSGLAALAEAVATGRGRGLTPSASGGSSPPCRWWHPVCTTDSTM